MPCRQEIDDRPRSKVRRKPVRILAWIDFYIIKTGDTRLPDPVKRWKQFIGEKTVEVGGPPGLKPASVQSLHIVTKTCFVFL